MGCSPSVHSLAWTDTRSCPDPGQHLAPPEVHKVPLLRLLQVHVDGILSLRHLNHTTAAWCPCKTAEGDSIPVSDTDEHVRLGDVREETEEPHHRTSLAPRVMYH